MPSTCPPDQPHPVFFNTTLSKEIRLEHHAAAGTAVTRRPVERVQQLQDPGWLPKAFANAALAKPPVGRWCSQPGKTLGVLLHLPWSHRRERRARLRALGARLVHRAAARRVLVGGRLRAGPLLGRIGAVPCVAPPRRCLRCAVCAARHPSCPSTAPRWPPSSASSLTAHSQQSSETTALQPFGQLASAGGV